MKIKDIVNRSIVDLDNCENEPIHIPGSIQPHGCLIAFDCERFLIEFCSSNCEEYFGASPSLILGKTFGEVFSDHAFEALKQYIGDGFALSSTLFNLSNNNTLFHCTVHKSGAHYILEAELSRKSTIAVEELFNQTRSFVAYMEQSLTLNDLAQKVAVETKEITGYDRVMIYKFDKEYNGEVIAESKRDDLEPFLGLHYPHTDIPSQARTLYLKNLLRMISDINYTPVPIVTINDAGNHDLDLSLSVLRSTSPIHVQYLSNMGVAATLTISLIHENKLWGLIACHHYSPKYITPDIRLAAQLQGHFLTSQIAVRQSAEEHDATRQINTAVENLLDEKLDLTTDSFRHIVNHKHILQVCNASGVAIVANGEVFKKGHAPGDDNEIKKLVNWCETYSGSKGYFSTNKLISIYGDAAGLCESAAGIIYHALGNHLNNTAIIWFRPETIHEINWAGDPNKAIIKDAAGLHPRKSFELWKQKINCQSREWLVPELNAAATYAHAFQKHVHLLMLTEEESKYKKLNEILKETNAELENINWISTHDLQEPLRKIQMMASRIMDAEVNEVPDSIVHSVKRMNASAERMQTLLKDILTYGRLRHTESQMTEIDLNELVQYVLTDLHEELADKQVKVTVDQLPVIRGIAFLLNQLVANLIRNSIKFGKENTPVAIHITLQGTETREGRVYHKIKFEDNGIGFEKEFSESIFKIFTKLHNASEYSGSGVGLALCKKIMQNHNGYISAEGDPGKGASFYLLFPVN